jgi:hypothetical protein
MSMESNKTMATILQMAYTQNGLLLLSPYAIHNQKSINYLQNIKKGQGRMSNVLLVFVGTYGQRYLLLGCPGP